MRYPDIEGEAIARDEEIARTAEMFDKFVKHVVDKEILLGREEYEMLGIDPDTTDIIIARALKRIMERKVNGR